MTKKNSKNTHPPDQKWLRLWGFTINSYAIGEVRSGRPPVRIPGGVRHGLQAACAGQGGEALPSPLRDPLFLVMRSGCEPSASVRGPSLDVSDPSLSLGFGVRVLHGFTGNRDVCCRVFAVFLVGSKTMSDICIIDPYPHPRSPRFRSPQGFLIKHKTMSLALLCLRLSFLVILCLHVSLVILICFDFFVICRVRALGSRSLRPTP